MWTAISGCSGTIKSREFCENSNNMASKHVFWGREVAIVVYIPYLYKPRADWSIIWSDFVCRALIGQYNVAGNGRSLPNIHRISCPFTTRKSIPDPGKIFGRPIFKFYLKACLWLRPSANMVTEGMWWWAGSSHYPNHQQVTCSRYGSKLPEEGTCATSI